jgi:putative cardiolipin synthase
LIVLGAVGCASLPDNSKRTESFHPTDTSESPLGKAYSPLTTAHPGQTGMYPIPSGIDAMAARLTLADLAQRSIDVQYYVWYPDDVGSALVEHLLLAADRGVSVRILMDDFGKEWQDAPLLALSSHPNVEVRLFNPLILRNNRWIAAILDLSRSTRRMHNKAFLVDNQVAIIGGRNIADDYFQASRRRDRADLDALTIGPTVDQFSGLFDQFWNSPAAFPIQTITGHPASQDDTVAFRARLQSTAQRLSQTPIGQAYAASPLVQQIPQSDIHFFWGDTLFLKDDPQKVYAQSNDPEHRKFPDLAGYIDNVHNEAFFISPYFVPARAGMDFLRQLRQRGMRVRILTNSLGAQDMFVVFPFYSKYRRELLDMGVELYEFKPSAEQRPVADHIDGLDPKGSLHAKVLTFDDKSIYVGSTNLDPRSANLNTEAGVIFDCTDMTEEISKLLDQRLLRITYRVEAVPVKTFFGTDIRLNWVTEENGSVVRLTSEPGRTLFRNVQIFFIRLLPIENQL